MSKKAYKYDISLPEFGEPYLLTPGPLTTDKFVKRSMLRDWGSWDSDFKEMTYQIRSDLLRILGKGHENYFCVPLQGSGTFVVEAMLGSCVPKDGKVLILANGAYGLRAASTIQRIGRAFKLIDKGDYLPPRANEVKEALEQDEQISHVFIVHCETSSGILNPIEEISKVTAEMDRSLLIDSMSAFGAIKIDPNNIKFEALVSSANKCIEGVPGFGFAFVEKTAMTDYKNNCHSLSLDLFAQWETMEKSGQWRFTPPTHAVAAFVEALRLHKEEGGVDARGNRYTQNRNTLVDGMRGLGFKTLLNRKWLSPIIVTFFYPEDQNFNFNLFYNLMKSDGFIIYPGKLTSADSFRVGCIGRITPEIMQNVVAAAEKALKKLGVKDAAPAKRFIDERDKLLP